MVIAAQIEHLRGNDMGGPAQEGKHRPGIGDTSPIRQREAPDSDTHVPGRGWAVRPPWTMTGQLEIDAFPLSLSPPVVAPEHLHSSAVCAVHLQVGHHSTAGRPELRCLASSFNLFSQCEQFIDALLRLERARRLTLPDVPAEITHRHSLSALRRSGSIPEAFLFHDATFSSAALLVRLVDDR